MHSLDSEHCETFSIFVVSIGLTASITNLFLLYRVHEKILVYFEVLYLLVLFVE